MSDTPAPIVLAGEAAIPVLDAFAAIADRLAAEAAASEAA